MIGRTLVLFFGILLMICFCLQYFLLAIPFMKQIEFERICHEYSMIMDKDGGLSSQNRERFVADLESRGFLIEELYADTDVPYEEEIFMAVKVSFTAKKLSSMFVMEGMPLFLNYQSKILSRKTVLG